MAVTNGTHFIEGFPFQNEVDKNYFKTVAMRLSTKKARSVLPRLITRQEFVSQMAHTAALVTAFATGDHELARRSLVDIYAEPRRAPAELTVHRSSARCGRRPVQS